MNGRKTYSGVFKAKVVSEWLSRRKSLLELSAEYRLHPNQIKNWKMALIKNAHLVLEDKRRKV